MGTAGRLVERLRASRRGTVPQAFPPGAFYSPLVDTGIVLEEPDRSRIWPPAPGDPPGVHVRGGAQLALLEQLAVHRFRPEPTPAAGRYDPSNDQFPPHDAHVLYAMVRHLRPRRVVEVGCGWSTTVIAAAIAEGQLGTVLTCIEPYPRSFLRTMGQVLDLHETKVEHTTSDVFDALGPGDVLFIDSSHVAKTGSDVVHLMLEVVPRLADGVVVHVHDIFMPADYPPGWVRNGFNWNEQYLLQAYLAGNSRAHVLLMNHWMALRHPAALTGAFGDIELNGSSLWFATGPEAPTP